MLDIAIIGSGPAAFSAAINAQQRNKKVRILGRPIEASMLYLAEQVDNYLGMPKESGKTMMEKFLAHILEAQNPFAESRVDQILSMGDYYVIRTGEEFIETKAIILALGMQKSRPIPGEKEMLGKGVSYCATCDGMLYRNKKVAVVGETEEGEKEANFLAEICEKVTYFPRYQAENYHLHENVTLDLRKPKAVLSDQDRTKGLLLDDGELLCDGIFFIKKTTPPDDLLFGLQMEGNYIAVDRNMRTNLPFVYAAGDCVGKPYQVSKAVGEGLVAALQAAEDLDQLKK